MADKQSAVATRQGQGQGQSLTRRTTAGFGLLERLADEMDRVFDDFGLGRAWTRAAGLGNMAFTPQVDVSQQGNELVVRADLPGIKKDDLTVNVADDVITIQGERRREREEERGGVYRNERSYGTFYRSIPLPEGTMTDQAKATFNDGVLEIRMPAPPEEVRRGRRLEIGEGGKK